MIASTGWTWEYVRDSMDLPRLAAMTRYWQSSPPLHVMVAAYLGVSQQPARNLNEASEFVPVNTLSADEFSDVLKAHGLPTGA